MGRRRLCSSPSNLASPSWRRAADPRPILQLVPEFPTSIKQRGASGHPPNPETVQRRSSTFTLAPSPLYTVTADRQSSESRRFRIRLSPEARAEKAIARMVCDFDAGTLVWPFAREGFTRRFIGLSERKWESSIFAAQVISKETPRVLVLMTMGAKVFPIAPVRRVVPGIAVFVMDGKQMKVPLVEISPAFGAEPPVNIQGEPSIVGAFCSRSHFCSQALGDGFRALFGSVLFGGRLRLWGAKRPLSFSLAAKADPGHGALLPCQSTICNRNKSPLTRKGWTERKFSLSVLLAITLYRSGW